MYIQCYEFQSEQGQFNQLIWPFISSGALSSTLRQKWKSPFNSNNLINDQLNELLRLFAEIKSNWKHSFSGVHHEMFWRGKNQLQPNHPNRFTYDSLWKDDFRKELLSLNIKWWINGHQMQAGPNRCAWLSFPFFQSRAFKLIPLICYHVSAVFHHALVIQDQLAFNRPIVSAP